MSLPKLQNSNASNESFRILLAACFFSPRHSRHFARAVNVEDVPLDAAPALDNSMTSSTRTLQSATPGEHSVMTITTIIKGFVVARSRRCCNTQRVDIAASFAGAEHDFMRQALVSGAGGVVARIWDCLSLRRIVLSASRWRK